MKFQSGMIINSITQINQTVINQLAASFSSAVNFLGHTGRSIGTIYQNTSGKTLVQVVNVRCTRSGASPGQATLEGYTKDTTPPDNLNNRTALVGLVDPPNSNSSFDLVFLVPDGWYFMVKSTTSNGSVVINYWTEYSLEIAVV